ncbi:MAG: hypothetical protein TREMPRED_000283 [Tremellales sp. Tagirdzhanova-0007]|nr:MAG: hypothetical protein TREMPRED_000283 [Tremellales sp. Tagirdzhanova-0007]
MASIVLPPAFPVVGLGIAAAAILNAYQQILVGQIRAKAGVKYPTLYVTEAEANADPIKMNRGLAPVNYIGFFGLFFATIGIAVQKTYQLYM